MSQSETFEVDTIDDDAPRRRSPIVWCHGDAADAELPCMARLPAEDLELLAANPVEFFARLLPNGAGESLKEFGDLAHRLDVTAMAAAVGWARGNGIVFEWRCQTNGRWTLLAAANNRVLAIITNCQIEDAGSNRWGRAITDPFTQAVFEADLALSMMSQCGILGCDFS